MRVVVWTEGVVRGQPRDEDEVRFGTARLLRHGRPKVVEGDDRERATDRRTMEGTEGCEDVQEGVRRCQSLDVGALHDGGCTVGQLDETDGVDRHLRD